MSKTEASAIIDAQNFFTFLAAKHQGRKIAVIIWRQSFEKPGTPEWNFMSKECIKLTDEFLHHLRQAYPQNDDYIDNVMQTLSREIEYVVLRLNEGAL